MIPCEQTPSKSAHPERPECVHGRMLSNGNNWICRDRRGKRKGNPERNLERVRRWRADPSNRAKEAKRARERYHEGRE